MTGITKSDAKTLGNGFWMTLVLLAGGTVNSLVCSGVMGRVSYPLFNGGFVDLVHLQRVPVKQY